MEQLLKLLIEPLVSDIKKIKIERNQQENNVNFIVSIPKEEIAKVIGKEGRMVKAIKNLLRISAFKENVYATIELKEQ